MPNHEDYYSRKSLSTKKFCPKCGLGYAWNSRTKSCKHCHWSGEVKTKKKVVEVSEKALVVIPKTPCVTMKMMREAAILSEKGILPEAIAIQMKKSVGWVKSSLLIFNNLPEKVHKAIEEHKLSRIAALQLLLCPPDKLDAVIDAAIILSETEGKL